MNTDDRFYAPGLQDAMRLQGRNMRWLANQLGVHEALLSHACRSRRTINGTLARRIEQMIGVPFAVLFKSPSGDVVNHEREAVEAVA